MQGGYQQQEEDKINILNAQVTELERRKKDLSTEIETHYRAYKCRLDVEYNTRVKEIEEKHILQQSILKKRESELTKKETFLENKISSTTAQIEDSLKKAEDKIKEAEEFKASYTQMYSKLCAEHEEKIEGIEKREKSFEEERNWLKKEKQLALNIQASAASIEVQNKDLRDRLVADLKNLEGVKSYNKYISDENEKKEEKLAKQKTELENKEAQLSTREQAAISLEARAKECASQEKALLVEIAEKQKVIEGDLEKIKKQGGVLSKWRDELNEQSLTLKEKDRFLVLKEREIDGKIKILKALREGEK
ncbi:MAG TPA: hypothetical protein DCL42_04945 [Deltaproteobacteria bacterium]|nr:hypothetical protein [Deltaproteobacteria bacterium]